MQACRWDFFKSSAWDAVCSAWCLSFASIKVECQPLNTKDYWATERAEWSCFTEQVELFQRKFSRYRCSFTIHHNLIIYCIDFELECQSYEGTFKAFKAFGTVLSTTHTHTHTSINCVNSQGICKVKTHRNINAIKNMHIWVSRGF